MTDRWTDDRQTDTQKNNVAPAHPYHEGKFRFPLSGLGIDSMTHRPMDGWKDGQKC